ncbi:MAG: diaminopimelate epimerase [Christensenellales bacterium]
MDFIKMHGLGNDFIVLQDNGQALDYNRLAPQLCDRRTGIGGDGLIIALPSKHADIRMRIINSDGSEAEMCGNGIRCLAKYALDQALVQGRRFTVETLAGPIVPEVLSNDTSVAQIRVDMGQPILSRSQIPMLGPEGGVALEPLSVDGKVFTISSMLVGVPHTMVFVDDLEQTDLSHWGPLIETHPSFPRRTNVNFVQVVDRTTILVRTWERGAGATLACGTGSCASAVAAHRAGYTESAVDVRLYLGTLHVQYENGHVFMSGPAETVFSGQIQLHE